MLAWPPGARAIAPVRPRVLGNVAAAKKKKGEGVDVNPKTKGIVS